MLYGSEMKDGNVHIKDDLPLVLLGGGQGHLQTGRRVTFTKGTPLANRHLILAQAFGAGMDDLNGASTGTLDGLFV